MISANKTRGHRRATAARAHSHEPGGGGAREVEKPPSLRNKKTMEEFLRLLGEKSIFGRKKQKHRKWQGRKHGGEKVWVCGVGISL